MNAPTLSPDLPPLPEPYYSSGTLFTAEQMRQYGAACRAHPPAGTCSHCDGAGVVFDLDGEVWPCPQGCKHTHEWVPAPNATEHGALMCKTCTAAWNRRTVSTDLPPLPHPCIYVTHDTETVYCGDVPRDSVPPHDDFYSADKVREYAAACRAGAAVPPGLHRQIMNLPARDREEVKAVYGGSVLTAYYAGHRDARHAAAELVSAALSAATGPTPTGLPEGFLLLPVEATDSMMDADWDVSMSDAHSSGGVSAAAWRAMVEAAPQVTFGNGHSGPGWYMHDTEYPEEGAVFLSPATKEPSNPLLIDGVQHDPHCLKVYRGPHKECDCGASTTQTKGQQ